MKIDTSYLNPGDVIVVACSGGPDSMCLLNLLLNDSKKFKLIAAHVNHKIRKESDTEYIKVEEFCLEHGINFEGYVIENYSNDNFHNDARIKRYNFFKEVIKKYDAKYLATAHHGDDLMETILMKIERGSNLSGYAGFREKVLKDNYTCIRPLIHYTKQEIEDYMNDNHLWYAVDNSNNTDHYTRNRYRHTVLPFLKNEDKDIHHKYYKFSQELLKNEEFIDRVVKKETKNCLKNDVIIVDEFKKLESFVGKRLIGDLLHRIYGDDLFLVSDIHIDNVYEMIMNKKSNMRLDLPGNVSAIKDYNEFKFVNNILDGTKEFLLEFNDYLEINNYIFKKTESDSKSNYVIRLDSSEITLPLILRNREIGDKMVVKNMNGSKKVKDILIDEKVNLSERDLLPIMCDSSNQVLWLPGIKKSKFDKDKSEKYDIIITVERKCGNEEKE